MKKVLRWLAIAVGAPLVAYVRSLAKAGEETTK